MVSAASDTRSRPILVGVAGIAMPPVCRASATTRSDSTRDTERRIAAAAGVVVVTIVMI